MPLSIDIATPPAPRGPVLARESYRSGALRDDFDRLSHPGVPMTDADILSFLVKYFHAVFYPGSEAHAVPLGEISDLFSRCCDVWAEAQERGGPQAKARVAFPLMALADLPRTAHLFRSVANRPLAPSMIQDPFVGLDLGTGSGILLAAAWFQAKRNGVRETRLFGLETDDLLRERTQRLFASLGLGEILASDGRDPAFYTQLPDGPIAFVGNANIPSPPVQLAAAPFCPVFGTVFATLSRRLRTTIFFPDSLVVRDRRSGVDVVLSKNNRFQIPKHYKQMQHCARSIVIEGRLTPLWQIGKDLRASLPESWRTILPKRW